MENNTAKRITGEVGAGLVHLSRSRLTAVHFLLFLASQPGRLLPNWFDLDKRTLSVELSGSHDLTLSY